MRGASAGARLAESRESETHLLAEVAEALKVLLEEAVERGALLVGADAHLVVARDAASGQVQGVGQLCRASVRTRGRGRERDGPDPLDPLDVAAGDGDDRLVLVGRLPPEARGCDAELCRGAARSSERGERVLVASRDEDDEGAREEREGRAGRTAARWCEAVKDGLELGGGHG